MYLFFFILWLFKKSPGWKATIEYINKELHHLIIKYQNTTHDNVLLTTMTHKQSELKEELASHLKLNFFFFLDTMYLITHGATAQTKAWKYSNLL